MVSLYTGRLPNLTLDDIAMPEPCILFCKQPPKTDLSLRAIDRERNVDVETEMYREPDSNSGVNPVPAVL
jgi:hypothetical protein